jgi:amino acid transporter
VVALLAVIYTLATVGLQGTVSPANLAKNSSSALVYTAQAISGGGWAMAMALSVIATTGTGIVLTARIVYGMASHRVLPSFLGNVSYWFSAPVAASVIVGVLIIVLALATIAYYRRRLSRPVDLVVLGIRHPERQRGRASAPAVGTRDPVRGQVSCQ